MFLPLLAILASHPIDIRAFGAVGDGTTLNTRAIQRAIDKAAKINGKVLIPEGSFLTGSLHLRSHVEINLAKGAVLLGSPKRKDYAKGVWYSLLIADKAKDVSITGEGTIDGNARELLKDIKRMLDIGELKIPKHSWRPSELDRPEILEFTDCRKARVEGVTIKNGICWVQTYRNCVDLTIKGIKVDSKTYWNNDGIDIVDCQHVRVANCDIDADDDGICLKSDTPGKACENIVVENCRIRSSASALKFGTSSHGGFRHIRVHGLRIHDTFRSAVALESVDGGTIEDVVVSDVRAVNTGNAFFIRLGHRTLSAPTGCVSQIVLRNFDIQVPAGQPDIGYPFQGPQYSVPHNIEPSSIAGLPGFPVRNVRLENIRIRMPGGGNIQHANAPMGQLDKVEERPASYPEFTMFGELPSWALYFRHVRGVTIRNLEVTLGSPDYRPAFVVDDVVGMLAKHVVVNGADKQPTVVIHRSKSINMPHNIQKH